jgi:hypothetical protein
LRGRRVGVGFAHQLTDQLICPKTAEERHQEQTTVNLTPNLVNNEASGRSCTEPAIRLRARDSICALIFDAIKFEVA